MNVVERIRKRQVIANMGERFTDDWLVAITLEERTALLAAAEELERWVRRSENQDPANDEPLYGLDGHDFWQAKRRLAALGAA